jgi:hypothetical protein
LAKDIETGACHPATNPFELAQWLTPYEWSDKNTGNWGPGTSASEKHQTKSMGASNDNFEHSGSKTQHQQESNRSHCS